MKVIREYALAILAKQPVSLPVGGDILPKVYLKGGIPYISVMVDADQQVYIGRTLYMWGIGVRIDEEGPDVQYLDTILLDGVVLCVYEEVD